MMGVFTQSFGQQSCSELFSQNYSSCNISYERGLAASTANLAVCMAGAVTSPLAPGLIAGCSASYAGSALVADMNYNGCIEMASEWFHNCVEW